MNWRVYRLPGSREIWHIDSGPDTHIFNVRGYTDQGSYSRDASGNAVPRAWIQIDDQELHIVNDIAVFTRRQLVVIDSELVEPENKGGKANC